MNPLEYRGQFASCKVFTEDVEPSAVQQIYGFLNCEAFDGCQIRIMPDVHMGKGACVGFTSPLSPKIIPNVIGVDIGCGVQAVRLGDGESKNYKVSKITSVLPEFDKYLRAHVPAGFNSRDRPSARRERVYVTGGIHKSMPWDDFHEAVEELSVRVGTTPNKTWCAAGTLGGGNHFLEIGRGEDGSLWLIVHSGSRNFGLRVAEFHQKKAVDRMGRKGGLEWLEGDDAIAYLRDMRVAQRFAMLNRLLMLDVLVEFFDLKLRDVELITSVHNFIGDDNIIRKGAISATDHESLIIPWNMRDGVIIGVGKGNADWNFSAPHGAGRRLSRGDAKRTLSMSEFKRTMKDAGIWTSCVSHDTLDEAPAAYKPYETILECIGDTVDVTKTLKPIYNFKASKE